MAKTFLTGECDAGSDYVDHSVNVKPLLETQLAWVSTDLATLRFAGQTDPADIKAKAGADLGVRRAQSALKALNTLHKAASKGTSNLFEPGEVVTSASAKPGRRVEIMLMVPDL